MATTGAECLGGGFQSSPAPLYHEAAVLVPFGTQAVLPEGGPRMSLEMVEV